MVSRDRGLIPAVFLDRDGVIVVPEFRDQRSFAPRRLQDFKLYPEAAASLHRLKRAGFLLAVVTNQPDVGNGVTPRSEVDAMHEIMTRELPVDAVKACFHRQADNCDCRKPKPGMILEAAAELGIDLEQSFMVGDRWTDIAAGAAAGCLTFLITAPYNERERCAPDHDVADLPDAARRIVAMVSENREPE